MKKLSIIIPVYNCEKYIISCLKSINIKINDDYEVIIVDDGSNDNTNNIISSYIINKKNFKLITIKNHGVSYARNVGIKNSNGKYIMFVDSDDLLAEDVFDYIYSIMDIGNFDLYQFSHVAFVDSIPLKENYQVDSFKVVKVDNKTCMKKLILGGCSVFPEILPPPWGKLYKKTIIDRYNIRFNENFKMFEDGIFNIEYLEHCKNVYISNFVIYLYRNDATTSATKKMDKYILNQKLLQINCVSDIIKHNDFKEDILSVFSFRCIKSVFNFYIFHLNNKMSFNEIKKEIKKIMQMNCFNNALKSKNLHKYLDKKDKLLYLFLKYRLYLFIFIFYKFINFKNIKRKGIKK